MELNVRILRAIRNINQSELARKSGVSLTVVRKMEEGGNYNISNLNKVLDVLGYELCVKEKGGADEQTIVR